MPIIVSGPPVTASSTSPVLAAEVPTISLVGNGDTIACTTANGLDVMDGLQGFDLAPYALASSTPGGWDGGLLEHVRTAERDVFIPLMLTANSTPEFRLLKKRLAALVDPKRGDMQVIVQQVDGTTRTATGRYVSGMSSTLSGFEGLIEQRLGVLVRCFDPAWLGPTVEAAEFATAGSAVFLSSPFFPMTVIGSQAFGSVAVDNPGDEDAYPVFTITGPGSDFVATNGSDSWGIDGAIAGGEVITVNTRRGVQTVENAAGASQWSRVSDASQLWTLAPGVNNLSVTITGATAATLVRIEFTPRYLTAW